MLFWEGEGEEASQASVLSCLPFQWKQSVPLSDRLICQETPCLFYGKGRRALLTSCLGEGELSLLRLWETYDGGHCPIPVAVRKRGGSSGLSRNMTVPSDHPDSDPWKEGNRRSLRPSL